MPASRHITDRGSWSLIIDSMKALFIGGTGTISSAITRLVSQNPDWQLYLINRGNRIAEVPDGVVNLTADIDDEQTVLRLLGDLQFDVVCDFIGFVPAQVERDIRLFKGRTRQYIYISSASAYRKPLASPYITESTPLANPFWQYSRDKIACEELLIKHFREEGFPFTIVRPSHTYCERGVPVAVHGKNGCWQVLKRMLEGKPVIIPGDGTSLWTITYNSDFARAFVGLMGNPRAIGEVFQLTGDENPTWNQIYQAIADALGVELKAFHVSSDFLAAVGSRYEMSQNLLGDKSHTVIFDNAKLKRTVPGFKSEIRYDQGIRMAVAHILAHPELQTEDPEFDIWCDKVIAAVEQAKKSLM